MRCYLILLLLVGAAVADSSHGWKTGSEYQYLVRSRTLTGMEKLQKQYVGVLIKGLLKVQAGSDGTLQARFSNAQYAHIHAELPEGVNTRIHDGMLEYHNLPVSGSTFEIKTKHGVIRDLIVEKNVPTWELNLLKSIVSQMQVDTQGENAWRNKNNQVPNSEDNHAAFRAMEDSVGGKCEVLYDIMPLPDYVIHNKPELLPLPELKGDGEFIDIMKTKNYSRCDQRMGYHYGVTGRTNWEPGANGNGDFMSKSSTSRIVISGNLKDFTIQSSVTTNQMYVALRMSDGQSSVVYARMNLTLARYSKISEPLPPPKNGESTGNLVYTYNNPFSESNLRKPRRPEPSLNSEAELTSSMNAASSSEERQHRHRVASSPSSSASSSSISSSEENDFWQPKPGLNDPPLNPLIPYFVGYKGKVIGASGKVDPVSACRDLVTQIALELEDPNTIPTKDTLEKYSILAKLLRTMSAKQLADAEGNMRAPTNRIKNDQDTAGKNQKNAWTVFRDALVQAGTGPAFSRIKSWIESGKIEGWEAAEVMSRISRTARTPTSEYMDAFFELISNPKVMNQRFLNNTAVLAFGDLVRYSQICNSTIHNRYPVHSFGRMSSKHSQTVFQKYIPFLAHEMQSALKQGNSPKAQAYIMALGNIGHPKMLSVFEPYLEGKEPATTFQRLMMVSAMGRMAVLYPKIARSVLYKIYLNTRESHEIRCIAVYLLMKTNPPIGMLQRMAEYTNYDISRHVNSAVKSTIKAIANLKRPEYKDMASKARAAEQLLNPEEYSYQYSTSFIHDAVVSESNFAYTMILNYIGSDDDTLPQDWYIGLESSYGGFKLPIMELVGMVSSVKDLLQTDFLEEGQDESQETLTEKIVKTLKIKSQRSEPLEGNILQNSEYGSRFMAYDEDTLQKLFSSMIGDMKFLGDGQYVSLNQLTSYEVTVSFPTETGLPFIYTFKSPTVLKLSGTAQISMTDPENEIGGNSQFRLLFSKKVQGRAGFITPFEHQHYMSGVDVNIQTYLPGKIDVRFNGPKKSLQVKLQTINNEPKARIFHFSVVPYTSKYDILSLKPVSIEKNTYAIHVKKPESTVMAYLNEETSAFRVEAEADELKAENFLTLNSEDPFQVLAYPWYQYDSKYRKMDVLIKPEFEENEALTFTATYDSLQEPSETSGSQSWSSKAKAPIPSDKSPDSAQRRKQLLEEAGKGIKSPRSYVVDLRVEIPGNFKNRHALTFAWARSNVDDKSRTLVYWHVDFFDRDFTYEVCAAIQEKIPWTPLWNYEKAINNQVVQELDADIRHGPSCASGDQINIRGEQKQSKELNKLIRQSQVAKACEEQMKQGNMALPACQKASANAVTLDEAYFSVHFESKILKILANRGVDMLKNFAYPDISVNAFNPKNLDQNRVDVKVKLANDMKTADVTVYTPDMDVTFTELDISDLDLADSLPLSTSNSMDMRTLTTEQDQLACILDYNQVVTFDGRSYPVKLGKCPHVLMTAIPRRDANNHERYIRIPKDMRVSVIAEETDNDQKQVKIVLGENTIKMRRHKDHIDVNVNDQKVKCSNEKSYQGMEEKEVAFELFEQPDKSVKLISETYDISAIYDGQRLQISASDKYRNAVRGLCGDYNGQPENDFTVPKNCVLKKPEEFAATYALVHDSASCEGPARENAKKAEKSVCARWSNHPSNVISDYEAGRSGSAGWGYTHNPNPKNCNAYHTYVVTTPDKICFSTRPAPACAPGCSPVEKRKKTYKFYCMQKSEAALEIKKRVENGANPDFSQKTVSMTQSIDVPVACAA